MVTKKKKKTKRPKAPEADLSFEESLEQLETLIDRVESGEAGLEEAIAQYERGTALVRRCRAILDTAEQRIAELTADDLAANAPTDDEEAS